MPPPRSLRAATSTPRTSPATGSLAALARRGGGAAEILLSSAVVYGFSSLPSPRPRSRAPSSRTGARSSLPSGCGSAGPRPARASDRPPSSAPNGSACSGSCSAGSARVDGSTCSATGANHYQLLDVEDLVAAIELAGVRGGEGVVNLGGRVSGTVRDDLEDLIGRVGSTSRVTGIPAAPAKALLAVLGAARLSPLSRWHRLSADHDMVFDCSRARELLGWEPAFSGADALARAYAWYVGTAGDRPAGTTHRTVWRERSLGLLRRLS